MGKERNARVNIFMCMAALLLCATLFSMHFTVGLYARYTAGTGGSDGARVAEFSITQKGTIFGGITADVTPGETESVELIIKNDSEVAMEYTLKVTNVTGNIAPLKFKLKPSDATMPAVTTESYDKGISINSARQIPGNHTDKYYLNIVWDKNADEEKDLALIGMVDYITVSVTATQID